MTRSDSWESLGAVAANTPSAGLFADGDHIYRIVDGAGNLCAPGYPSMTSAGMLWRRPTVAVAESRPGVKAAPISGKRR